MTVPKLSIDADGDLTLVVGPRSREFLVCSKALSRASRVFKCMLNGPFKEARPEAGPWVVTLPEDNDGAAELMLYITHSMFDHVPATLSVAELYDALVFADKYDMMGHLCPWIEKWLTQNRQALRRSKRFNTAVGICWATGDLETFEFLAKRICVECKIDDQGQLVGSDLRPLEEAGMPFSPPGFYQNAAQIRLALRKEMLSKLREVIEKLQAGIKGPSPGYCMLSKDRPDLCQAVILGSIFNSIKLEGIRQLINVNDESHYDSKDAPTCSLVELDRWLNAIQVLRISDHHLTCDPMPQLRREIKQLLILLESPIGPEHDKHLKKQQEKLRLPEVRPVSAKPNSGMGAWW